MGLLLGVAIVLFITGIVQGTLSNIIHKAGWFTGGRYEWLKITVLAALGLGLYFVYLYTSATKTQQVQGQSNTQPSAAPLESRTTKKPFNVTRQPVNPRRGAIPIPVRLDDQHRTIERSTRSMQSVLSFPLAKSGVSADITYSGFPVSSEAVFLYITRNFHATSAVTTVYLHTPVTLRLKADSRDAFLQNCNNAPGVEVSLNAQFEIHIAAPNGLESSDIPATPTVVGVGCYNLDFGQAPNLATERAITELASIIFHQDKPH